MPPTARELNDAINRRTAKAWGGPHRRYWLINPATRLVATTTADAPASVEGYGIYDGQIIGEDESRNARESGRIKEAS